MDIDDSRHHWRNRYLLMRHGHSQANAQGTIISSPERGLLAYGLSPQGEQQPVAVGLGAAPAGRGVTDGGDGGGQR